MRQKIVAGNWKMNKTLQEGLQILTEIINVSIPENSAQVIKIIAPPFTHLYAMQELLKHQSGFYIAAQNCHHKTEGAFTGEVSAKMLASMGVKYVIIGHSERRQYFGESNLLLAEKVNIVLEHQMCPLFCIGESLEQRNANQYKQTVKQQLKESLFQMPAEQFKKVVIAYEPVWAIGTGVTATSAQAQEMHAFIRNEITQQYGEAISESTSILYGGSCNAQNAQELFACEDVDGGLIGGASLKSADFMKITQSF